MEYDEDFIQSIQEPDGDDLELGKKEEYLIIEMVHKNYSQFVRLMIELGAKIDVDSRKPIKFGPKSKPEQVSVFKIAYENRNEKILALLMLNSDK